MLSKGFYLGSIIGSQVLMFILTFFFIAGAVATAQTENVAIGAVSGILLVILVAVGIFATVVNCVLMYKAWFAIQDEHARTTPGKAIGFSFIPFFNIYWVFQLYWGFSKDYNAYVQRYEVDLPRLPEKLFLWYCILPFMSILPIPFLSGIISVAIVVIFIMVVIKICDAVNALYIAGNQMAMEAQQSEESQELPVE